MEMAPSSGPPLPSEHRATTYTVWLVASITGVLVIPTRRDGVSAHTPEGTDPHSLRCHTSAVVGFVLGSSASKAYRSFFDVVTKMRFFRPVGVRTPRM